MTLGGLLSSTLGLHEVDARLTDPLPDMNTILLGVVTKDNPLSTCDYTLSRDSTNVARLNFFCTAELRELK